MQKNLGNFSGSQFSPHAQVSPGTEQSEREGQFHRVQLVLKKSQFSEDWHFSDGNEQFEFVLEEE